MSAVLPLQTTSVICIVRALLDINDKHLQYRKPAELLKRRILQNRSNVTALKLLLQYMTQHYPRAVTSQVLEFLVPFHLKTFDLTKCTEALQLEGEYTSLLPRLSNVRSLIHTEGLLADPLPVSIAIDWSTKLEHLTSVTLEECPGVTDKFVSITHLNLARCSQITDSAFLNVSEACPPKLSSLDVSGCDSLTSTAIRLLTELCGPSLRHLNIALTNMDCTILWYLAGHSLASSVRLASEVRGKINNLADAISSQMDRLIHEFQFITEKLKEMGERDGEGNEDGEDGGQSDADDRPSGELLKIKKPLALETVDHVCEKANDAPTSKSSLDREISTEKQADKEEEFNDNLEDFKDAARSDSTSADAETVERKKTRSYLPPDGMNEYLEHYKAHESGFHTDGNTSKEDEAGNAEQDKSTADSRTGASSSFTENGPAVNPIISNSEINKSQGDEEEVTGSEAAVSLPVLVGGVTEIVSKGDVAEIAIESEDLRKKETSESLKSNFLDADDTSGTNVMAEEKMRGGLMCTETVETPEDPSNSQSLSENKQINVERAAKTNERDTEGKDKVKVDPCSSCLHNSSKAHIPTKLFEPQILSLKMDHIEFHADLIKSCFDEFFSANRCLQIVTIANRAMTNELLQVLADHCPDLSFLCLMDCAKITNEGLAYLLDHCKHLKALHLHGVPFLNNSAFYPILNGDATLHTLHLAEVRITDGILHKLSKGIGHSLKELNLNWCEDITSHGILSMAENCPLLESFSVRQFQVNESTLRSFAENCPKMKYLDLSGVEEMTDSLLAEMMPRFRMLKVLDVSWTLNLTNDGVAAILCSCPLLTDLNLAGLKRITEKPFLPIISDINRWRRCQALIKLKLREQKVRERTGQDPMSSDEEYEDLYVPVRSTSYAPLLQRLDLQFCDLVKDNILEEIVAVCCGSLEIIDYYGLEVCPKLLKM
ncbi:hypothetical protein BSL78_16991 [Apostichopus japonicus]|uniref:F-box/LRR-repeat protein 15-like leucin rich repeat domain-containing protein n=1 Tax=Stichopus japonicus TaxID=307972 RepID=A0A2G8KDT6_STIJA|nr:hypothetical protein BSL78_16991 [Apostichopus japonicus]